MTPQERRHERTKQSILEAARRIVAEKGPDGLSMRLLAQRIDYSPAGLYEYFGSKEEIIQAVCQEGHQRLSSYLRRADPARPPAEYLLAIGLAYIEFALQNADFYLLMFTTTPNEATIEGMTGEASSYNILLQAIQRGIEAGVFKTRPGFDLQAMAYAAWSLVHGIAMLRLTYLRHFPADFGTADREALLSFNRGLQTG